MILKYLFAAILAALPLHASAAPAEVRSMLAADNPTGSADVRQFGLRLYRAELWTRQAGPFSWSEPFALTLDYKRAFDTDTLVRASIDEMARVSGKSRGSFADLAPKLARCFADVRAGDRITGFSRSADRASFFLNGRKTCDVNHAGFRQDFFGIWLTAGARDPRVARILRGSS